MPQRNHDPSKTPTSRRRAAGSKTMAETVHLVGPGVLRVRNRMPCWEPIDGEALLLHPERLQTLLLHGSVDLTGAALRALWGHGVQVSFLSVESHRLLGRINPPAARAGALAFWQHQAACDAAFALEQARRLVREKLESIERVAAHLRRHGHAEASDLRHLIGADLRQVDRATSLESLRGIEGASSARWHRLLRTSFPRHLPYPGRKAHPPTDPVNALLSLGYTFLLGRTQTLIDAIGLDPLVGVYHQLRSGRPALACDLIEPFRVPVVDQMVLAQIRQRFFLKHHFHETLQGVRLQQSDFRRFLEAFEQRLTETQDGQTLRDHIESRVEQFAREVRSHAKQ